MIARYTWLAIMVAAMICADQWGVAKQQINHLLAIIIIYGVSVELINLNGYSTLFNQQQSWLYLAGFIGDLLAWSAFIYYSGGPNPLITFFDGNCRGVYGDANHAHHRACRLLSLGLVYAVMVLLCAC